MNNKDLQPIAKSINKALREHSLNARLITVSEYGDNGYKVYALIGKNEKTD